MNWLREISQNISAKCGLILLAGGIMLSACTKTQSQSGNNNMSNPLFSPSTLPFEAPDFDAIKVEHYRPAFEAGMEQELKRSGK